MKYSFNPLTGNFDINTIDFTYDATVADAGADYTDIMAAYTDGKRRLLITGALTMANDVNVGASSELVIYNNSGSVITVNDGKKFTTSAGGQSNLIFAGTGRLMFANSVAGDLVQQGNASNFFAYTQGFIINGSTAANSYVCSTGVIILDQMTLLLPNQTGCGFWFQNPSCKVSNVLLIGGGAACSACFRLDYGVAENISTIGTFDTTNFAFSTVAGATLSNFRHSGAHAVMDCNGGNVSNVTSTQDSLDLKASGQGTKLSNIDLSSGFFQMSSFGTQVSNLTAATLSTNAFNLCALNNCFFTDPGSYTITGDNNVMLDIQFPDNVLVQGDNNDVSHCRVGDLASGKTITIDVGATNNIISNNRTAAAIVDNGTGTGMANNLLVVV